MKRFFKLVAIAVVSLVGLLIALGGTLLWLGSQGHGDGQQALLRDFPELAQPARPFEAAIQERLPRNADELFSLTNIWAARLSFTAEDWEAIRPSSIPGVPNAFNGDKLILRNPKAKRSGLSGVIGLEFNWTKATLELGSASYTNVAVRYRGNGTYLNSQYGPKQSFKADLNKFARGQSVAGLDEINLLNSIADDTYLRDALAHRLFRELGVAAPRTGYAYVSLNVPGAFTNQPLGLYVVSENIDSDFAKSRFGTKKTPIFKPVTYELFAYLGEDWTNYASIYDLKTEATSGQLKRLVDFARLVSNADDAEFNRELPSYLDLDQFASFVAGHVLLSACDGFLANGQNFYMYLDPKSEKFGFIPWDQDHSFGEFGYVQTAEKREQMSIWEPYLYDFRFLQRVMRHEAFRAKYRAQLEHALASAFDPQKLYADIDALAAQLRPAVEAENPFRLNRFDQAVSSIWPEGPRDGHPEGPRSPVRHIKRFITNRAESVRAQLDGKNEGVVLRRTSM